MTAPDLAALGSTLLPVLSLASAPSADGGLSLPFWWTVLESLPGMLVTLFFALFLLWNFRRFSGLIDQVSEIRGMGVSVRLRKEFEGAMDEAASEQIEHAKEKAEREGGPGDVVKTTADKYAVHLTKEDQQRVFDRATRHQDVLVGKRILWVDDHPENNKAETRMFEIFRVWITHAVSNDEAIDLLGSRKTFDLIISDIQRDGGGESGLTLPGRLKAAGHDVPVLFYCGILDETKGTPPGARAITNRPDELLHLAIDVFERAQ